MSLYVVVHLAATCDDSAVYVPRDACELLEISWCTVDPKTLAILPRESILVKPANTPITPGCNHKYKLTWDTVKAGSSFKDAVAAFDRKITKQTAGKDFTFVTVGTQPLRVLLPREARDKQVVLPLYLQHPRVFDLTNEYLKWQLTHAEAMSYPGVSMANITTALGVEVPAGWSEDAADDARLTAVVYAQVLTQLMQKSVPVESHPSVLTRPYDGAHDAKVFLAERSKTLYLLNLPPDTTQSELESWFTQYGGRPIAFWTLKSADPDTKSHAKTKGAVGFAVFAKHEDAADSLYMNGRVLNDKVVEVQASSTRVLDRAQELLTPFPPLKNRPRPGDWTCPSCGFSNFQRRIACFRCLFPAASAVAIQELMYGKDYDKARASGGNGSGNGGQNVSQNQSQSQGQGQNLYSNYYGGYNNSNNNTNNNYASGYHGYARHYGSAVPFRAGDWKCANEACQYHNFAKNLCCLKCGSGKPAAGFGLMNKGSGSSGSSGNSGNSGNTGNNGNSGNNGNNSANPGGNSNPGSNAAGVNGVNGANGSSTVSVNGMGSNVSGSSMNSLGSVNSMNSGIQMPHLHSVNSTAAAIAAATASGQPLNLANSYTPHRADSASPQGYYGKGALPQHLALLQGQARKAPSGLPGLYSQGYYKDMGMLSGQINLLSLNNT